VRASRHPPASTMPMICHTLIGKIVCMSSLPDKMAESDT
jgi:hypothetical protein